MRPGTQLHQSRGCACPSQHQATASPAASPPQQPELGTCSGLVHLHSHSGWPLFPHERSLMLCLYQHSVRQTAATSLLLHLCTKRSHKTFVSHTRFLICLKMKNNRDSSSGSLIAAGGCPVCGALMFHRISSGLSLFL